MEAIFRSTICCQLLIAGSKTKRGRHKSKQQLQKTVSSLPFALMKQKIS
jgi:hypothetical protein